MIYKRVYPEPGKKNILLKLIYCYNSINKIVLFVSLFGNYILKRK